MIFHALDVRQDGVLIALFNQAHGNPRNRLLDRNTSIHQGKRTTAHTRHRSATIGTHHLTDEADGIREFFFIRNHRAKSSFC